MIDLTKVQRLELAICNAARNENKGTQIMYWRGATDTEPKGKRKFAFDAARNMSDLGLVRLKQKRYGFEDYGYIMEVVK